MSQQKLAVEHRALKSGNNKIHDSSQFGHFTPSSRKSAVEHSALKSGKNKYRTQDSLVTEHPAVGVSGYRAVERLCSHSWKMTIRELRQFSRSRTNSSVLVVVCSVFVCNVSSLPT